MRQRWLQRRRQQTHAVLDKMRSFLLSKISHMHFNMSTLIYMIRSIRAINHHHPFDFVVCSVQAGRHVAIVCLFNSRIFHSNDKETKRTTEACFSQNIAFFFNLIQFRFSALAINDFFFSKKNQNKTRSNIRRHTHSFDVWKNSVESPAC